MDEQSTSQSEEKIIRPIQALPSAASKHPIAGDQPKRRPLSSCAAYRMVCTSMDREKAMAAPSLCSHGMSSAFSPRLTAKATANMRRIFLRRPAAKCRLHKKLFRYSTGSERERKK